MKKIILMFLLVAPVTYANQADVQKSMSVIKIEKKVTMNSNTLKKSISFRQFTFCANNSDASTCRILGLKRWYKRSDLTAQGRWEIAKATGNTFVTFFFGSCTIASLISTTLTAGATTAATIASGSGVVTYAVKTVRRMGDFFMMQYIDGKEIDLSSYSAEDAFHYALEFERVLDRI